MALNVFMIIMFVTFAHLILVNMLLLMAPSQHAVVVLTNINYITSFDIVLSYNYNN